MIGRTVLALALAVEPAFAGEGCKEAPAAGPSAEVIEAAAHIFSGVVTAIDAYACDEPGADSDGFTSCRVTLTVWPEAAYEGRLMPPGDVPVEIGFSARSYGPAAGDPLARIASGLVPKILVVAGSGRLVDGRPTLTALADGCGRSQVFDLADPTLAAALEAGRLTVNPVPEAPPAGD